MNCIYCGKDTKVDGSVKDGKTVYRKRKCLECGKVFYTEEIGKLSFANAKNEFHRLRKERYQI